MRSLRAKAKQSLGRKSPGNSGGCFVVSLLATTSRVTQLEEKFRQKDAPSEGSFLTGRRNGNSILFLLLAPLTLLLSCAPAQVDRDLSWFRETDRYAYLAFDMNGDTEVDYIQRLDRAAGWKDAFYLDLDFDGLFEEEIEIGRERMGRFPHIILAVDGFPYREMVDLRKEGHFLLFRDVGRMIAPYPSLTAVAWKRILDLDPPGGYEEHYFDKAANRMAKGAGGHVFPQHNEIIGSLGHAVAYVQVRSYAKSEREERLAAALERLDEPRTLLYFLGTDASGHRSDAEEFREILLEVDRLIERIFYEYRCHCRLTILSDHGNNRMDGEYVDLIGALEDAGFRCRDSIEKDLDFVAPRYGMIGAAAIYTRPGNLDEMARVLAALPGVGFCTYKGTGGIQVVSNAGRARVLRQRHRFRYDLFGILSAIFSRSYDYQYEPIEGDPLDLIPVIKDSAGLSTDRLCLDRAWFEATWDHYYPDPLHRLADAHGGNVQNTASLLVDLRDGHYFSGKVRFLAHSAGTHGNLAAPSSLGVVGTNWCEVPPAVRADEVNEGFRIISDKESRAFERTERVE